MDLSHLGVGTGGVWTHADAARVGLTRERVRRRVERGEWQRLRRGVFTDGGIHPDTLMRAWAAVVAAGGPRQARASGRTTARLLGLPLIDDDDPATRARDWRHDDVAVPPEVHLRRQATLHVRRLTLVRGDRVRIGGCPSVSLACALPTLAAVLSYEALVCLLDAALHRGLLDRQRLQVTLVRHRGQPQVTRLRAAVAAADGRGESPAETLARLTLLPVLPDLEPQVRLQNRQGRVVARFDLADRRIRLAVEADGRRGHSGDRMVAKDQRRDRTTGSLGWVTERCTWWELRRERAQLQERIAATAARLAARRAAA